MSLAASAHFCVCVGSHRVYKRIDCLFGSERGGAARLARGAHNPKVGSSNLPPATNFLGVGWWWFCGFCYNMQAVITRKNKSFVFIISGVL